MNIRFYTDTYQGIPFALRSPCDFPGVWDLAQHGGYLVEVLLGPEDFRGGVVGNLNLDLNDMWSYRIPHDVAANAHRIVAVDMGGELMRVFKDRDPR